MACKEMYIWGTGRKANELVNFRFEELKNTKIKGFIDNDKDKWGKTFYLWNVYSPEVLNNSNEDLLICSIYSKQIIEQIKNDYPSFKGEVLDEYYFEKIAMINRYKECDDIEIKEIVDYLRNNDLNYFNYDFAKKYEKNDIEVFFDKEKELYYADVNNNKMFFSKKFKDEESVLRYYKGLLIEQDVESPHRYITSEFDVSQNSVIVDAGAAEGFFSLSVLDKANKLYLFEPDEDWCEALRYTFENYLDKVVIVPKALSNYVSYNTTTVDKFFDGVLDSIDFIKMDIEGEEYYALKGAEKIIRNSLKIRLVVCTYHQEFAYDIIKAYFEEKKFKIQSSKGYMWFDERNSKYRTYVLRRGLIRARKD